MSRPRRSPWRDIFPRASTLRFPSQYHPLGLRSAGQWRHPPAWIGWFQSTWAQPIELGHRQAYREQMAKASYCQTRWNVLQAELAALIQTYRLHQTALYRREKLAVAQDLNTFNTRLVETLRRQAEANQATAADVVLAEVENQATIDQLEAAGRITSPPWRTFGSKSASRALRPRPNRSAVFACPKTTFTASGETLVRLGPGKPARGASSRGRSGKLAGGPRAGPCRSDPHPLDRPGLRTQRDRGPCSTALPSAVRSRY